MRQSLLNLPATYSVQAAIADWSLSTRYILRFEERVLGIADSLADAKTSAQLHEMLFGGETLH